MEELRAKTTLFCAALALAIAGSLILRGRKPAYFLFSAFAGDIALWWASQSLSQFYPSAFWTRATAVLTLLIPVFGISLFQAILPVDGRPRRVETSLAIGLGIPLAMMSLTPYHRHPVMVGAVYVYVFGFLGAGLFSLAVRGRKSPSRAVRDRVRFLVGVGALATIFTMGDFASFLGLNLPPIGAVLSVVFLFVLSESLIRPRLADLYEMAGRLLVATALAFSLAALFYIFVSTIGRYTTMYNAILTAIVFIVLFDPLRTEVEKRIHQFFFRERYDFETSLVELNRQLSHAFETREVVETVLSNLEASHRVTLAAFYLQDQDGHGFDLEGFHGHPDPPKRLEALAVRPILDRLQKDASLSIEELAREPREHDEAVLAAASAALGELKHSILVGVKGEDDVVMALLLLADDRVRDAFNPEEVNLLAEVATQIGVALANSRIYNRMKERDRLAALGSMAAGLAHEIKNPLGAIKGAAQLLEEGGIQEPSNREFVGIILEEVDRLNRVVGSFLNYARPHAGNPIPLDVNAAVKRAAQILASQTTADLQINLELYDHSIYARIDPEQFRQILFNLVQNAIQAMNGKGAVTITTGLRRAPRRSSASLLASGDKNLRAEDPPLVEVAVRDTGPGIAQQVLKNLFVPFFTTKVQGTGLGLAISQSIVQNVGGRIDVHTQSGAGTTFSIILQSSAPASVRPEPLPVPTA